MKILITGTAGFIGFHLTKHLLDEGHEVVGIDSLNDYYDTELKFGRLRVLGISATSQMAYNRAVTSGLYPRFRFIKLQIEDRENLVKHFAEERFEVVINLAAQAGVRHSIENPHTYINSNIDGVVNLLECCRRYPIRHLLYASSGSVYGDKAQTPSCETGDAEHPVSLYAATKRSNELIVNVYSHLYRIPSTGLRLFTAYGPWGRPDMAPMIFASAITSQTPIQLFNNGDMMRDFTYIDDIVESVSRLIQCAPEGENPTEIYNIGGGAPTKLLDFIHELEQAFGHKAIIELRPMQKGDVHITYADTRKLEAKTGYKPHTPLAEGVRSFAAWYLSADNPLLEKK